MLLWRWFVPSSQQDERRPNESLHRLDGTIERFTPESLRYTFMSCRRACTMSRVVSRTAEHHGRLTASRIHKRQGVTRVRDLHAYHPHDLGASRWGRCRGCVGSAACNFQASDLLLAARPSSTCYLQVSLTKPDLVLRSLSLPPPLVKPMVSVARRYDGVALLTGVWNIRLDAAPTVTQPHRR